MPHRGRYIRREFPPKIGRWITITGIDKPSLPRSFTTNMRKFFLSRRMIFLVALMLSLSLYIVWISISLELSNERLIIYDEEILVTSSEAGYKRKEENTINMNNSDAALSPNPFSSMTYEDPFVRSDPTAPPEALLVNNQILPVEEAKAPVPQIVFDLLKEAERESSVNERQKGDETLLVNSQLLILEDTKAAAPQGQTPYDWLKEADAESDVKGKQERHTEQRQGNKSKQPTSINSRILLEGMESPHWLTAYDLLKETGGESGVNEIRGRDTGGERATESKQITSQATSVPQTTHTTERSSLGSDETRTRAENKGENGKKAEESRGKDATADRKTNGNEENTAEENTEDNSGPGGEVATSPLPVFLLLLLDPWGSTAATLGELLMLAEEHVFFSQKTPQERFDPPHDDDKDSDEADRDDDDQEPALLRALNDELHCRWRPHEGSRRNTNLRLAKICRTTNLCNDTILMRGVCMTSKVHVVAESRVGVVAAKLLMEKDARLRVLYLVTDPRQALGSGQMSWSCDDRECGRWKEICRHQQKELTRSGHLLLQYPNRYKMLQYSNLTPETLGGLWKFLGLRLSPSRASMIQRRLHELTGDSRGRGNPASTSYWRTALSYQQTKALQKACRGVLKLSGLRLFRNEEEYRDLSLPSWLPSRRPLRKEKNKHH